MQSYFTIVDVSDGAYIPGYRTDEVKKVSHKVLYEDSKRNYNPVGDEINSYMSGESYLSSINDLAVIENSDITKVPLHRQNIKMPVINHLNLNADTTVDTTDDNYNITLLFVLFVFLIIIAFIFNFIFNNANIKNIE
jgi:hypothetical protein